MYVSRLPDINTQYVVYDYKWEVCLQTPNINKLNVMVGTKPIIVSLSILLKEIGFVFLPSYEIIFF